jgi:hypothetical protein
MTAAMITARPLITPAQLEHGIEVDTPVAILDAQLMQLADHPQRLDIDSMCELLAVLDQQHRRGRLDAHEFQQLKARIAPLIVSGGTRPAPPRAPPPALRSVPRNISGEETAFVSPPKAARRPPMPAPIVAPAPAPASISAPSSPPIGAGQVLRGRYELRRLLGEGGMSCVWEAIDRLREGTLNREARVAVKLLRPSVAARGDAVQALHLEFERAQSLSHPSIVNVLDLDADGDLHFIVMERLEGELLSEVIKRLRPGRLPHDQAFAILARLGDAASFAHDAGIVHADIKPGNVMLTHSGELRLFDFGAAWPAQREPWIYEASERSLQGATPTYASAERLGGSAPTVRDDVFSFACLAYELLSGSHPYGRQPAHEAERQKARAKRIPGLSRRQWRALERGLAFRREDRWPDLKSMLQVLLPARAAHTPMPLHYAPAPDGRPSRLSGGTMLVLGALAFAIAHYANADLPPPVQVVVDVLKGWAGAAMQLVR